MILKEKTHSTHTPTLKKTPKKSTHTPKTHTPSPRFGETHAWNNNNNQNTPISTSTPVGQSLAVAPILPLVCRYDGYSFVFRHFLPHQCCHCCCHDHLCHCSCVCLPHPPPHPLHWVNFHFIPVALSQYVNVVIVVAMGHDDLVEAAL